MKDPQRVESLGIVQKGASNVLSGSLPEQSLPPWRLRKDSAGWLSYRNE